MTPALLIIDMQKAWFGGNCKVSMKHASEKINSAIELFEAKGFPVIWIRQESPQEGIIPGSDMYEFIDALHSDRIAIQINKHYSNSFNKTTLHSFLKKREVDTVIVSGFCAEWCVLSTYRGAEDLDYRPFLLAGGVASGDPENLGFVEKLCQQITLEKIIIKTATL